MLHYRRPHTHYTGLLPTSQYGQVHESCLCCNVWYAEWQECGGGVRRGRTIQRVMGDQHAVLAAHHRSTIPNHH